MQTFVVTHNARAKVIKPCYERQDDDTCKDCDLVRDCRQGGVNGFLQPGGIFAVHKTLLYGNWVDLYIILNVLTSLVYLAAFNINYPGVEVFGSTKGVMVKVGAYNVLVGVVSQTRTCSSAFG